MHFNARRPSDCEPLILKRFVEFQHPRFGDVQIEFGQEGEPVRHSITHGGRRLAGAFPSQLMGRPMPWESIGERNLIHHLEFDPSCSGFLVQPHWLRWYSEGVRHIYCPDAIAIYQGVPTVLECKKEYPARRGEDLKYRMAGDIYRSIGWGFAIVTAATLSDNPSRLLNHQALCRNRFVVADLAFEIAARRFISNNGNTVLFQTLTENLVRAFRIPVERVEAMILALIARRILRTNLEKRISSISPVQLAQPSSGDAKGIKFWENVRG